MNENGKAKIQVEDNGPGICDEMKPHIFEMFYTGKIRSQTAIEVLV